MIKLSDKKFNELKNLDELEALKIIDETVARDVYLCAINTEVFYKNTIEFLKKKFKSDNFNELKAIKGIKNLIDNYIKHFYIKDFYNKNTTIGKILTVHDRYLLSLDIYKYYKDYIQEI